MSGLFSFTKAKVYAFILFLPISILIVFLIDYLLRTRLGTLPLFLAILIVNIIFMYLIDNLHDKLLKREKDILPGLKLGMIVVLVIFVVLLISFFMFRIG